MFMHIHKRFVSLYMHIFPHFKKFSFEDVFLLMLERKKDREKKRERYINVREISHQLVTSPTHSDVELNPQPEYVS